MLWLKLPVPFGCGLSQNAPASIKNHKGKGSPALSLPCFHHTTPTLCRNYSPHLTDRKIQTLSDKSPLDFRRFITRGLCDVPHLPCAPPQESQQCPQQCWPRTEFRLSFKQVLSSQNTGFCDVPIFNQSQVQSKLACLEVGMC